MIAVFMCACAEGGTPDRYSLNRISLAKGSEIQIMYVGAKSVYDYAAKKYTTGHGRKASVQNSGYVRATFCSI